MRKSSGEGKAMTSSSHREIRESPVAAVPDGTRRIPVVLDPAARKRITQWVATFTDMSKTPFEFTCPTLATIIAVSRELSTPSVRNLTQRWHLKKVDVQGHAKTDAMARRGSKRDNERREQRERCS